MTSTQLAPNRRLRRLNRHDVLDLAGERLELHAQRLVNNRLVTAIHAEGDILRGRVREKPGLTATAVKLRLPDGHPALTWALEQIDPVPAAAVPVFTHLEAALLLEWSQKQQPLTRVIMTGTSGMVLHPEDEPDNLEPTLAAFNLVSADALWQGMRGPCATLAALLMQQRIPDVRRIAKHLGLSSTKESKETLIPQITPRLLQPERIRSAIERLSPLQRGLLTILSLYDHGMSQPILMATAQQLKLVQTTATANEALTGLRQTGMIFCEDPAHDYSAPQQLPLELTTYYHPRLSDLPDPPRPVNQVVPVAATQPDLLATLRGLVLLLRTQPRPTPAISELHSIEQSIPSLIGWHNDPKELDQLARQTRNLWNIQYDNRTHLTIRPPLPLLAEHDLTNLAQALGSSPDAIHLLLRLLDELALLEQHQPVLTPTNQVDHLLGYPVETQRRLLATTWAYMTGWSEIHDLSDLQLRRTIGIGMVLRPDQLYAELAATRRFVLRILRMLEPEQWYPIKQLLDLVQTMHPRFLFEQRQNRNAMMGHPSWWLTRGNAKQPLKPDQDPDWQHAEARLLRYILIGPLRWLGLLEAGGARSEYIRLTPEGAFVLGLREHIAYAEPAPNLQVDVEPDGATITVHIALSAATPAILHALERVGQTHGLEQRSLVFGITARTLRDGMLRGETVANLHTFLQRYSANPLPDGVQRLLEGWGAGFGQATIYTGMALIELADDILLPELQRNTRLSQAILEQLSPRLLLIDPARADDLFNELVAKGYTPRRIDL
jgi:hypothetical protein